MKGKRLRLAAVLPFIAAAFALAVGGTAHAGVTPTTVTATTAISNHQDGGHGTPSVWAYDDFNRTLTVTLAPTSSCTGMGGFNASTDNCYTAHIADNGKFNAIKNAGTPNGTGGLISNAVTGNMVGSYDLTMYAPSADVLSSSGIPANRNDNFTTPATSTTNWPTLALTPNTGAVVAGGAYNWTYNNACEKWVDSSTNGDGVGASDGNITGVNFCVVASSNTVQVKNRATSRCLNEDNNTGLLSTYTCYSATYASLQWKVVTFSDGTKSLMSVQTGKYVKDNGKGTQLSLTTTPTPMNFINGGVFQFASDSQVMTVNKQGNFVPVVSEPGANPLNNGRWDFGALA